jgi:hypothetical protein
VSYFRVATLEAVPTRLVTAPHRPPVAPSPSKANGRAWTGEGSAALAMHAARHDDGDFKRF